MTRYASFNGANPLLRSIDARGRRAQWIMHL